MSTCLFIFSCYHNVVIMFSHLLNLLMLRHLGQCVPSHNCTVCGLDKICAELRTQGCARVMTAAVAPKSVCGSQHPDLYLQSISVDYDSCFWRAGGLLTSHGGLFSSKALNYFKI